MLYSAPEGGLPPSGAFLAQAGFGPPVLFYERVELQRQRITHCAQSAAMNDSRAWMPKPERANRGSLHYVREGQT